MIEITAAHLRRLKALGLSEQWYIETFERLGGKCERCGKQETTLHYGQPKPLVVDTSMKPPRLICQKCSQRKNKTNQRKREAAKQEAEDNKTAQIYWGEQRRKLSEGKRAEYEALEADAREQFEWAVEHMQSDWNEIDETDEDRTNTQKARNDFEAFVQQRGIVFDLIVSALPQFWRVDDGALLKQLLRDNNEQTRVFLQYGYYVGMPSTFMSRWNDWRKRVEWKPAQNPTKPIEEPAGRMMVCVNTSHPTAPCHDKGMWMSRSIIAAYAAKGVKYLCHKCLSGERASRAEIAVHSGITRETAVDAWGRIRADGQ